MRVREQDTENLRKLPSWVKCLHCGKPPTQTDWLIEIVPNSSALIHQSCAAGQGKVAGLNIGTEKGD